MKIEFIGINDDTLNIYKNKVESGEIGRIIGFGKSECSCIVDEIVTVDGDPSAFITISAFDSDTITIDYFVVVASKQGHGIGKAIVSELQTKYDSLSLIPQDIRAQRFWESCGFVAQSEDANLTMEWHKK